MTIVWDVADNELPMWVADMDFRAAPEIREAFMNRIEHGVFGYANVTGEWYEAYIEWWKRRHGLTIAKDSLIFCTGVVPAISSIVRKLTGLYLTAGSEYGGAKRKFFLNLFK